MHDRQRLRSKLLEILDGSSFENLAVYELLRRKVEIIVACDATADRGSASCRSANSADLHTPPSLAEPDFGVKVTCEDAPSDENGDITESKFYYFKPSIFSGLRLEVV